MSERHLEPTLSDRGFQHMRPVDGWRGAGSVKVFESSNAETPCVHITAMDDRSTVIVQLDLDSARQFSEQIAYLLDHHYQRAEGSDGGQTTTSVTDAAPQPTEGYVVAESRASRA